MMKLRRSQHLTQRSKWNPQIGVDQKGLPVVEHEIDADRDLGKAECKDRQQRRRFCQGLVDRMESRRGQPIELLDAVMDRVQSPQQRNRVKRVGAL